MIKVLIAKLGSEIQEVEIPAGSNVSVVLRQAGFSLDTVLSVKRNGVIVNVDELVNEGDVFMVSQDKIKGGNDVILSFDISEESGTKKFDIMASDEQSTFEIVKSTLNAKGISMNRFSRITEGANAVSLGDVLEAGKLYTIHISKSGNVCCDEDCEDCD